MIVARHPIVILCSRRLHLSYLHQRICVAALLAFLVLFASVTTLRAQQSLSIEEAVATALKNNWDIILAHNDVEAAHAADSWGATAVYPTVAATGSATTANIVLNQQYGNGSELSKSGITQNVTQASVLFNWKVFDGMKMFATKSRLNEQSANADLQFRNRVSQTIYDVSLAYYNLVRLHQQLAATNELLVVLEERRKLARLRFSVGSSAKNDQLQAEIDYNDQHASLLAQQKNIEQAEISLAQLMGLSRTQQFTVSDSIALSTVPNADSLNAQILVANYSVLSAQRDLNVALEVRRELAAQGLPSVNLSAGFNVSRSSNSAVLSSAAPLLNQNSGPVVGIGVSIPLFNGMSTQTQLDVQDILIHKYELQIDALKSKLLSSYQSTLADLRSARDIEHVQSESVAFAKENASIAMERFRRQNITTVELRQIQLSVLLEETALLNTRFSAKAAELQLMLLASTLSAH